MKIDLSFDEIEFGDERLIHSLSMEQQKILCNLLNDVELMILKRITKHPEIKDYISTIEK